MINNLVDIASLQTAIRKLQTQKRILFLAANGTIANAILARVAEQPELVQYKSMLAYSLPECEGYLIIYLFDFRCIMEF